MAFTNPRISNQSPLLKKFMTEEKSQKMLVDIALKKPSKKTQFFLLKTALIFSVLAFGYLGFRYLVFQSAKKLESQKELQKFDNIESEIFDLSIPADDSENGSGVHDFSDMAVNDLREKGAEFVYQMLLKNQVQISVLSKKIENLDEEIVKYKNQQRISRMILLYIDLRTEIFSKKPFEKTIESFELVAINDSILASKIAALKESAKKFNSQDELKNEFSQIIPKLIIAKKTDNEGGFWAKIKAKISQIIIIRQLNSENPAEIDSRIVKIEKLLTEEKYQEALTELLSFEQKYHEITSEFLDHLSAAIEIRSIDNEILNHLKSLS